MSELPSYNLLCKPWIPVVWRNDAAEPRIPKIGIRESLLRAPEIQCISHTAPFIEFGLYRLLITIVLDAYIVARQRPTIGKMEAMIEAGHFDDLVLDRYLEEYKERFDLWGKENPFLQMHAVNGKSEDISKMIAPVPSGTKIAFWHHYAENETSLNEEEAAQELCAVAPFCFDYAPKDICTIGGDPALYIVVHGDSLFETIVYNLPRPSGRLTARQEMEGGPTWRCPVQDTTAIPHALTLAQGWTWPVRQIRLVPSGGSSAIGKAVNISGVGKTAAKQRVRGWRDPNAGTITNAKGVRHIRANDLIPRFAQSSDQNPIMFWRDLVPMCLVGSEGEALRGERVRSRPEVITNALRITDGTLLRLSVYGFVDKGGQNNKLFRTWFRSVLTLPTEVARDNRLSAQAINAFKTTQKVADALQTGLRMLRAPSEAKKTARKDTHRDEGDALAVFWQSLEPVLSHSYLDALARKDSKAEEGMWGKVRRQAREAFSGATGPQRRTADGLFRIANASNWFERRLRSIQEKKS